MNYSFLDSPQIDLNALHLLRLVAHFRNITVAAEVAGISQSALTRQVQAAENRLGIQVFERTTRSIKITEAGAVLLRETESIPNILKGALQRINEDYLGAARTLRIGISRSLSLSHIPGIFHAQQRLHPEVKVSVSQPSSSTLLQAVATCQLDLAILTKPKNLPKTVSVTHLMEDELCLVCSQQLEIPEKVASHSCFKEWSAGQQWIIPPKNSQTRQTIDEWCEAKEYPIEAHTELDSFDLMLQLVALNMGVALVPKRSLSSFSRKHQLKRINIPYKLSRELAVIIPKRPNTLPHVRDFVESILFS
ncbi:MAG: DNA-binding transcriptional LysR family regulator [Cryomorphaceae bacterium]|jgi:DNA-binding transcriptional LysR family regulator